MEQKIFIVSPDSSSVDFDIKEEKVKDQSKRAALKLLLRKKIYEWSRQSTSHGIPRLAEAKSIFVKLMWSVFLLISITLCSFMIFQSISSYLNFEVTTKIREISLDEIEFPAVSICNINRFVTPEANHFVSSILYHPSSFNWSTLFVNSSESEIESLVPKNLSDISLYWLHYITNHPKINDTILKSFSFWPSLFYDCHFRYAPCNSFKSLEHFYHTDYGNCFRFNGIKKNLRGNDRSGRTVGREGDGFGISMFIGPSDKIYEYSSQPPRHGIKIFITERDVIPFSQQGVLIKPGTSASIKVSRVDSTTLSKPYSNCQEAQQIDTELAREMKRNGMRYTRRDCVQICVQKLIIDRFNCYSLDFPKIFNVPPCPKPVEMNFDMKDCVEQCPHVCSSTSYDLRISYGEYPSSNYMYNSIRRKIGSAFFNWAFKLDEKTNSLDLARDSLVELFVYFDEIKYTEITEAPTTTFVDLIASIGGTLGLFIGVSLLSFVELIELILEIIAIFWVNYKTKKSTKIGNIKK